LLRASFLQSRCVLRTQRWRPAWVSRGSSAPPSNTRRLLARDHAAPESTLALTKAAQPCCGRVRPLAWCSRPRNSAALLEGALAAPTLPRRAAPRRRPPVVELLEHAAVAVEAEPGRSRKRYLLAVLDHDGPPLHRGAVIHHERLAHPDLGLSLLLGESPACVLE